MFTTRPIHFHLSYDVMITSQIIGLTPPAYFDVCVCASQAFTHKGSGPMEQNGGYVVDVCMSRPCGSNQLASMLLLLLTQCHSFSSIYCVFAVWRSAIAISLRFSTIKSTTKTDDSRRSKYAITTLAMLTEIPKNYQKGKNTGLVLESLLGDVRGQVGRMNDKRGKAMARCCMIPTEGVPLPPKRTPIV